MTMNLSMDLQVSIITPSFNRADVIRETADSIFAQSYPNWEWMIVDDGSTDDSWEVLEEFAREDSRVRILKRDRGPKGACACRNIGVAKSSGELLIFLDSDDVLAPFCLEQRVNAINRVPDAGFVIVPMLLFKKSPYDLNLLWNIDKDTDEISRLLTGDAICQGTGTIWRRSHFERIGMWREDLKLWQDVELHLRAFFQHVPFVKRMDMRPDVFIRISDVSLSRTGYNSLPKIRSRCDVFCYTLEQMAEQNKLHQYRESVAYMGAHIILSAIRGGFYRDATEMICMSVRYDLFPPLTLGNFRRYFSFRKRKMNKIPLLGRWLENRTRKQFPVAESTLGKVSLKKNDSV